MPPEPRRVASGSFRVNRAQALKKLARFQLQRPGEHVLAFCRAAVAAGATQIEARRLGGDGFELLFNGRPFSREELEDPYAVLFDSDTRDKGRLRSFAAGLLGALQMRPAGISVASPALDDPVELLAQSPLEQSLRPPSEAVDRNRIRVWGLFVSGESVLSLLASRWSQAAPRLVIDGTVVAPEQAPAPSGLRFPLDRDGIRGALWPRLSPDGLSEVAVSVLGVEAERTEFDLGPSVITGEVRDDRLSMDASQDKVVRDARWSALRAVLRDGAQLLLDRVLHAQRERLRAAGRLVRKDAGLLREWNTGHGVIDLTAGIGATLRPALRRLMGAPTPTPWNEADRVAVAETAACTRWLRQAVLRGLEGWEALPSKPSDALKPLWTASVFLDWKYRPVAVAQLRSAFASQRKLKVSRRPAKHPPGPDLVVWLNCTEDERLLQRLFPPGTLEEVG